MATSINIANPTVSATATVGSEVSNPTERKTQRVLETRDQWSVVFKHLVRLVVMQAKSEALPEDPRKGFAFKRVADQPHIKSYALGLLRGFTSAKARKFFAAAKYEVLADDATRKAIAIAIVGAAGLSPKDRIANALLISDKQPAKQAKSFCTAVLAKLAPSSVATEQPTEPTSQPTVEQPAKPKRTSRKASKPSSKAAAKKSNSKAVSK